MNKLELIQVGPGEIDQLQEIGRKTFVENYSSNKKEEDMKAYLDEKFSAVNLKKELSDTDSLFFFALLDNRVVGYLEINSGASHAKIKDARALEIERLFVLKEFYELKVEQDLLEKAVQVAREKGLDYVWIGVWEKNQNKIEFYQKNGFVEFDRQSFKRGNDAQKYILMKLQINN